MAGSLVKGGTAVSDHVERTIEMVQAQISDLEQQLSEKKKIVNSLCGLAGRPPIYEEEPSRGLTAIRSDEFYGKPLATAVREVLERRKLANLGAASVAE